MKTKKIIVFRSDLLHRSETFILEQVRALSGWTPVLTGYRILSDGLNISGIQTYILPGLRSGFWMRLWLRWCQLLNLAHPPTVAALRDIHADFLHTHFGVDAVDIWPSAKRLAVPVLVTLHGYDINTRRKWWAHGKGGLRMRFYPGRLLRMAADPKVRFIAVSEAIKTRAIEYGIPPDKIDVSYVGVDTNEFHPSGPPLGRRCKRILFVGRMVENKGPLLLIKSFLNVLKVLPDARLVLLGDGTLMEDAKQLSKGCSSNILFLGAQPHDVVKSELQRATFLCLPSVAIASGASEAFGQVLIEAQAAGVPVIGSNIGGIPETMIPGVTGYLFPPGDEAALTACLVNALQSPPKKLLEMSRCCRHFVESKFDIRRTTLMLEKIYLSHSEGFMKYKDEAASHDYYKTDF